MERGRKVVTIIVLIILILVAATAIYITFFYSPKCNDISCWETKLVACSRANYLNEQNDVIWQYKIKGKNGGNCEVNVKLIEIKRGLVSTKVLEGEDMNCFLPLGAIPSPESNINLCHGALKEEMEALIINKLHEYVVQNLGIINQDLLKAVGGAESSVQATGPNTATTNSSINDSG